jgi:diguanylate cyclase (GGDEF)-like protein/PAS domain S-box-containing protein
MNTELKSYTSVLDGIPAAILMKDSEGIFVYLNDRACFMLGFAREQLIGKSDLDFFPEEQAKGYLAADKAILASGEAREIEEKITDMDGFEHTVITHKTRCNLGGQFYIVGFITDITPIRDSEERVKLMAFNDSLTGLPNRRSLFKHLDEALINGSEALALILIDLDGFKAVNDNYGHIAGDELLKEFGFRLKSVTRSTDHVVRMGGDEFAVMVHGYGTEEAINSVCQEIINRSTDPIQVMGVQVHVEASLGVYLVSEADVSSGECVRKSDNVLYAAKRLGKGRFVIYSSDLDASLLRRTAIEAGLKESLNTGDGLKCYYQPVIEGSTGRVIGAEALARWSSELLGDVSPAQFVLVAEETGLINQLGEWVLRKACEQAKDWELPLLSVNVSPLQLRDPHFSAKVLAILAQTGFKHSNLELEITESTIVHANTQCLAHIKTLRASGISISLDDFGSGYSSLQLLRELDLDRVKIDKSFVKFVNDDGDAAAIVEALTNLGHALGLKVTAEGVETDDQRNFLLGAGCKNMQGYFFSKPVDAESFLTYFNESILRSDYEV